MGSSIPDYGLYDENGNQILSRNPRFAHAWFASKHINVYDNVNFGDMLRTQRPPTVEDRTPHFTLFGTAYRG